MKKFRLGISGKIFLLSSMLISLMIASLTHLVVQIEKSNHAVNLQQVAMTQLKNVNDVNDNLLVYSCSVSNLLVNWNDENLNIVTDSKKELESAIGVLGGYAGHFSSTLESQIRAFHNRSMGLVEAFMEDDETRTKQLMASLRVEADEIVDYLGKKRDRYRSNAQEATNKVLQGNQFLRNVSIYTMFGAFFLSLLFAWIFQRSITKPIRMMVGLFEATIEKVRSSSILMATSAQQITETSSEQSAAVQETISSMTEMEAMVAKTTDQATESHRASIEVAQQSERGELSMVDMVEAMKKIAAANDQLKNIEAAIEDISEKTAIINKIVDKTQLLSFNASIEAARAGQHGKGFAVVAHEVGNLAASSGKAADEIRSLLDDSKSKVSSVLQDINDRISAGQKVTQDTNQIFSLIAKDIAKITKQTTEVKEASDEQKLGLGQISRAMTQLDSLTTDCNLSANRNTELAQALQEHARELTHIKDSMNMVFEGTSGIRHPEKKIRYEDSSGSSADKAIFDRILGKVNAAGNPADLSLEAEKVADKGDLLRRVDTNAAHSDDYDSFDKPAA